MARPSDYTAEKAADICAKLVMGESLRSICSAEDMPAIATVYLWLGKHPEFMEQYTRAREDQADTLADEIIDIADDATQDTIKVDGVERPNSEWINRSRLRVDARKWVASKLKPKKYGDKTDHNVAVAGKLEIGWLDTSGS